MQIVRCVPLYSTPIRLADPKMSRNASDEMPKCKDHAVYAGSVIVFISSSKFSLLIS